jgi:hypothetical protein
MQKTSSFVNTRGSSWCPLSGVIYLTLLTALLPSSPWILELATGAPVLTNTQTERQPALYAMALESRIRIPFSNITCAYFDENGYFQFPSG